MHIKFKATSNPTAYTIEGEKINGIDLSLLEHGDQFIGNDETKAAGIRHAERDSQGELWVTLQQAPPVTRISFKVEGRKAPITLRPEQVEREGDELVVGDERWTILRTIEHRGGDWTESEWIDAADYDADVLYIKEVQ